jgi:hypothetical protein
VLHNPTPRPVTLDLVLTLRGDMFLVPAGSVWMAPGYTLDDSTFAAWAAGRATGDVVAKTIAAHDSLTVDFPILLDSAAAIGAYTFRGAIFPVSSLEHTLPPYSAVASNSVTATFHH